MTLDAPDFETTRSYDHWTAPAIEGLELNALRRLLCHARDTVSFYRELFRRLDFHPEAMTRLKDVEILPLLDKPTILAGPQSLRSSSFDDGAVRLVQTGGSTGEPFRVFFEKNLWRTQQAFNWALWSRLGIQPGQRVAVLSGMAYPDSPTTTVVDTSREDTVWIYRPAWDACPPWEQVLHTLREYQPVLIRGYPSVVAELAQAMVDLGESPLPSLKGVSLSSEDILPAQRAVIERAFGVRCYGFYGHAEGCVLAMDCEVSHSYHLYPGYAYVELVDEQGRVITESGQVGEVVGTSLLNYAMPMVRYRTGDLAAWDKGPCGCGREHRRLSHLAGRKRSRVVLPGGRAVYFGRDIYHELWQAPDMFRQIQFVQTSPQGLEVRIVPFPDTDQANLKRFVEGSLRRKLSDELVYDIHFVASVERTSSGKYLLFLQKYLTQ